VKVIHLSTSDMGGAGIAAKRLHLALLHAGVESKFLTLGKHGLRTPEMYLVNETLEPNLKNRVFRRVNDALHYRAPWLFSDPARLLAGRTEGFEKFSFPYGRTDLHLSSAIRDADVVNLHWVADGLLDYRSFFTRIRKPVVWTLHDMNPFTGGCHHSDGSLEFMTDCMNCKQLIGARDVSVAGKNLAEKIAALRKVPYDRMTIVTPSGWLGKLSSSGRLFGMYPHEVIPNVVSSHRFGIAGRAPARAKYGIAVERKVVLFVANDITNPRKGIRQLLDAVKSFGPGEKVTVCTVGKPLYEKPDAIDIVELGFILEEERMAEIYSLSDVFVLPSAAENFPNTIVEALLCGVPVVATRVGGIPEQVTDLDGILVENNDAPSLAAAIRKVIFGERNFDREAISLRAHARYADEGIVSRYKRIYDRLHEKRK
jgi:glycosyltransferase involved in cell wall biosynthesis